MAPDSFKGSLNAVEAAEALERGLRRVLTDARVVKIPIADGGEGTARVLVEAKGGRFQRVRVSGPTGTAVTADLGALEDGKTAVIEAAQAAGAALVSGRERNPWTTTTFGVGELIRHALDLGCSEIIVTLGGSATNDAGAGMLQALGASLKDAGGRELPRGGGALLALDRIDLDGLDPRLKGATITAACDVDNPLCGPDGASCVYGPQKGAPPEMVAQLDAGLRRFGQKLRQATGVDVTTLPRGGAAGGLGAALAGALGAALVRGIEMTLDAVEFVERARDADLVITGEGSIDSQSAWGKAAFGVLEAARPLEIPVVVVAGGVSGSLASLHEAGFAAVVDATPRPMSLDEALACASESLERAGETVARLLSLGGQLHAKSATTAK